MVIISNVTNISDILVSTTVVKINQNRKCNVAMCHNVNREGIIKL